MKTRWLVVFLIGILTGVASAQSQPPIGSTPPIPAPAKPDSSPVQYGGTEAGDHPSAAVGTLSPRREDHRIFGLPVTAALVIGGAIVVLFVVAGIVAPGLRRRGEARARTSPYSR